jgi:hypothetical protein
MLRLACVILAASTLLPAQRVADVRRGFENPPDDARIMMRWWWFGPAVTKPELEREMRLMKEGGIGGFEVQPVYPLALDGSKPGFRNLPYLSDEFLDALRFTSEKARELGLRMDLTLCSGWPYGGPHTPITEAAGRLLTVNADVPAGESSLRIRKLAEGEKFLAAFAGTERLPDPRDGVIAVQGPRKVQYFIAGRTKMMVKRAAAGAEGYVLDHYSRAAIDHHLRAVGDRLAQVFGLRPPYAVFSDSLEVFASDWTDNMLDEFRKRRGYDLTPYLPMLVSDLGEKSGAVRCDWGKTLTELVEENYLQPVQDWARAHHTRFRSQTYGTPPVALSSNALVDLPEGEHPNWRQFSQTRWAASASHLYGKPVTSSETWTWLHSPVFRATPLDMKAEADLHFLQGINQLVGHGRPYSPPDVAGYPGWRFYAAAVFNNDNPWWIAMPDIAKYLQRTSWLLRQGKPANDVALYLPTSDARARFTGGRGVSVDRSMDALLGDTVIPQILDAGYNFDYIDDAAIEKVGIPYPILVLPGVERIPLSAYKKVEEYARKGGIVVATRRLPSLSPGLLEGERDTAAVRALSDTLFRERGHLVQDEKTLGAQLRGWLQPDLKTDPPAPAIGFVHRKLDDGDIYFLVNTSNQRMRTDVTLRAKGGDGPVDLAPYESRTLVFSPQVPALHPLPGRGDETVLSGWKETRNGTAAPYFSGTITYEATVTLKRQPHAAWLDFGEGTPVPETPRRNGMRAWLESPVREAAVVYANDQRAGTVWCPPYSLNVKSLLHVGENRIRIVVGNLAINALAGRQLPDYKDLIAKYGDRFQPQDLENLRALPAGLTGDVRLFTW